SELSGGTSSPGSVGRGVFAVSAPRRSSVPSRLPGRCVPPLPPSPPPPQAARSRTRSTGASGALRAGERGEGRDVAIGLGGGVIRFHLRSREPRRRSAGISPLSPRVEVRESPNGAPRRATELRAEVAGAPNVG